MTCTSRPSCWRACTAGTGTGSRLQWCPRTVQKLTTVLLWVLSISCTMPSWVSNFPQPTQNQGNIPLTLAYFILCFPFIFCLFFIFLRWAHRYRVLVPPDREGSAAAPSGWWWRWEGRRGGGRRGWRIWSKYIVLHCTINNRKFKDYWYVFSSIYITGRAGLLGWSHRGTSGSAIWPCSCPGPAWSIPSSYRPSAGQWHTPLPIQWGSRSSQYWGLWQSLCPCRVFGDFKKPNRSPVQSTSSQCHPVVGGIGGSRQNSHCIPPKEQGQGDRRSIQVANGGRQLLCLRWTEPVGVSLEATVDQHRGPTTTDTWRRCWSNSASSSLPPQRRAVKLSCGSHLCVPLTTGLERPSWGMRKSCLTSTSSWQR